QRNEAGWYAGFLDSELDTGKMAANWQNLRNFDKPLLIVIDYVETRQEAFLDLLKASLQHPNDKPVRMLLLARDGGEWWDTLPGRNCDCEAFLGGYDTSGPFRLSALYTKEDNRQAAYNRALQAFSSALEVPAPEIVPDLSGEHFERPLFIQMSA